MTDSNKKIDVGVYEIDQATIENPRTKKKIQVGQLIAEIVIKESMLSSYLSADITILDNHAILDEFPIIGEETFTITYKDYYDIPMTHTFQVYGVDQVNPDSKSESQAYILHLISYEFFKSETIVLRKFVGGNLSDVVKEIFTNNVGKEIECDESDGHQSLIIPAMTPFETIKFLTKRAYSSVYNSSSFFFYQNRNGYKFRVYESLIEKQIASIPDRKKFYYGEPRLDLAERSKLMNNIVSLDFLTRFNLINEIRSGAMISEVLKLDAATKTFTNYVYKHYENMNNYVHTDRKVKPYHTEEFIQEVFSENNVVNSFMTFEDSTMDNLNYGEILPTRNSGLFYLNKLVTDMVLLGANDIFAGDLINLDIKEIKFVNGDKNKHPNLSGNYLIETIEHHMVDRKWTMKLRLLKDAFVDD